MSLFYMVSRSIRNSPLLLWSLFIVNFLGTIYGYIWYGNQIAYTLAELPAWVVFFVPDSPTASLFFTLAVLYLLFERGSTQGAGGALRGFIEAFAVVTSIKYGIWAVAMIIFGAAQGDALLWQDWMLVGSHLGMAVEALLFVGFFTYRWTHLALVAVWSLLNDLLDYHIYVVYPWLPSELTDDLRQIEWFTILLSVLSIATAYVAYRLRKR
jgi:uncharacterized membrane protein YpjA